MSALTEWPREAYDDGAFRDFDPAAGFTLGNARAMAWTAKLAYETAHAARMRDVASAWGLSAVEPFTSSIADPNRVLEPDTRGLIAVSAQATVVALAGTDPLLLPNWITNLQIRMVDDGGQRLHAGFRSAAAAALPVLKNALGRLHDGSRPLVLAGHSLGGALALVIGRWLEREPGLAPRGIYTFGMPRVGDSGFATDCGARLGDRLYRLVHGDDIVTCVPFTVSGYRHAGRLLRCSSGGCFSVDALSRHWSSNEPDFGRDIVEGLLRRPIDPAAPAWPAERSGLVGRLAAKLVEVLPAALRDHLPDRYITACSPN